jgi:eukaryotic translation initiation factor 2C
MATSFNQSLDQKSIDDGMAAAKAMGANFIVLLLPKKNIPAHSVFKDLADRKHGLHSLCLTEAPNWIAESCDEDGTFIDSHLRESLLQYLANVSMKMNLKANGINHEVKALESTFSDTVVLGADVTHPSPGCIPGCPSIAAVVGSIDESGGKYLGSMRLQERGNKEVSPYPG